MTQPGQQLQLLLSGAAPLPRVSSNSSSPNSNTTVNRYSNTDMTNNSSKLASLSRSDANTPTSIRTSDNITVSSSSQRNHQRSLLASSNSFLSQAQLMSTWMPAVTQSSINPSASAVTGSSPQMMQQQQIAQHQMGMPPHSCMGPMLVPYPQATTRGQVETGRPNIMPQPNVHGGMGMNQAHYMQGYNTMHHMQPQQIMGYRNPTAIHAGQPAMHTMNSHMIPHTMQSLVVSSSVPAHGQIMHSPPMVGSGYTQNSIVGQLLLPLEPMPKTSQPQMQVAGPPTQQVQQISLMQQQMSPQQQQVLHQQQRQQSQQQQQQQQQVNTASISPAPGQQQPQRALTPPLIVGSPNQAQSVQQQQQQQQLPGSIGRIGDSMAFGGQPQRSQPQLTAQQKQQQQQQQHVQAVQTPGDPSTAQPTQQQTAVVSSVGDSGQTPSPGEKASIL